MQRSPALKERGFYHNATVWINREITILSEMSQTQKDRRLFLLEAPRAGSAGKNNSAQGFREQGGNLLSNGQRASV